MSILHKFSPKGITERKGVQESQTVLLLVQYPSVFSMLPVNDNWRSTPTGFDKMMISYCIYSMLLRAVSYWASINDFLSIRNNGNFITIVSEL